MGVCGRCKLAGDCARARVFVFYSDCGLRQEGLLGPRVRERERERERGWGCMCRFWCGVGVCIIAH